MTNRWYHTATSIAGHEWGTNFTRFIDLRMSVTGACFPVSFLQPPHAPFNRHPQAGAAVCHHALGVLFYQTFPGELPGKQAEPPSRKIPTDLRLDKVVLRAVKTRLELRHPQASVLKTQVKIIASTQGAARSPALSWMRGGVGYHSMSSLSGLPLLHMATRFDPAKGRKRLACGLMAIGDVAHGTIAIGGMVSLDSIPEPHPG